MSKIKGIMESFIFSNLAFMVLPSSVIGFVASGSLNPIILVEVLVIAGLIDLGINVLNNYSDWNADLINKKRTEMHRSITKRNLLLVYLATVILAYVIMYSIGASVYLYIFATAFVILGILYSCILKLENVTPINYIVIALGYALLPIGIGFFTATGALSKFLVWLPIAIFLTLVTFSSTITKDYPDIVGDKAEGKRTLPVIFGKDRSTKIQISLILISYAFLVAIVLIYHLSILYAFCFVPLLISIYILMKIRKSDDKIQIRQAAKYNKWNHFLLRAIIVITILLTSGLMVLG